MLLKEREVRAIKSKFPNFIANIVPIFDETEGQLYDYTAMGIKPSEFYDERLKARASSVMITMARGTKAKDGSFPSFDIQIWPPMQEGGSRTDACGKASDTYYPEEILEALIAHTQYGIGFQLEVPAPAVDPKMLDMQSAANEGVYTAPASRSTPSPINAGINVPSKADDMRAEQKRQMEEDLAEIGRREAEITRRENEQIKRDMARARDVAPPRPSAKKMKDQQRQVAKAPVAASPESVLETV